MDGRQSADDFLARSKTRWSSQLSEERSWPFVGWSYRPCGPSIRGQSESVFSGHYTSALTVTADFGRRAASGL